MTVGVGAPSHIANGNTLANVEHVLIRRTIRWLFLLIRVAVQVQHTHPAKCAKETLAHSSEGRVVQIPMIRNVTENSYIRSFDDCLRLADELHIVVLQPDLPLAQRNTISDSVCVN